jgi:hypothetical protein
MSDRRVVLLLVGLLLGPRLLSAQTSTLNSRVLLPMAPSSVRADSTGTIRPGAAMLRSALLPGWGQLSTGHLFKAAWVAAAGATFVTLTVRADNRVSDLADRRGSVLDPVARSALEADIEAWRVERRRWLVWSATLWIYAVVDAYVDARLHDFDAEEPRFQLTLRAPGIGARTPSLGLQLNLGRSR